MKKIFSIFLSGFAFFSSISFASIESGLRFQNAEIESGSDIKQLSDRPDLPAVDVYAESLLSKGRKQKGIETTEFEELGAVSSDLLVSESSNNQFSIESILSFQHWGGKKTAVRRTLATAKDKASMFLASVEFKDFRQEFVTAVLKELGTDTLAWLPDELDQFQNFLERFLQELFIKQQVEFVSVIQNFEKKKQLFRVKTEGKKKAAVLKKALENGDAHSIVSAEAEEDDEGQSFWSQMRDTTSAPENPTPVSSPKKTEPVVDAKPSPTILKENADLPALHEMVEKPTIPNAEIKEPLLPQTSSPEKVAAALIEEPKTVILESVKPAPVEPSIKKEPENTAVETSMVQEPKKVSADLKLPSLPGSFQAKTDYHPLLAAYQILQAQRLKIERNSTEYLELSRTMAGIKKKLQGMDFYRKKIKDRNAIEEDVSKQLNGSMNATAF